MNKETETKKEDTNKGFKELEELREILKNPELFWIIDREFDKKIVGEKETRQTVFLYACGRLVENNLLTSYNLMVNSPSGAGKDYIVSNVLEILPKNQYVKMTRITENVFTYWHNPKYDPDWNWNGKVFYNEDISNNVLNSDVFKTFSSSGSKATVLIKQTPVEIEIKGKPVMIITTATANPKTENLRRFTNVDLDETVVQTKAIKKFQIECAKKGIIPEYNPKITEALSLLNRVKVKIPYADILENLIPDEHIIVRTAFPRLLDCIKASAALYQYQREKDQEGFLLATEQDYDIARTALIKSMSNPQMIPLTKDQKRILDIFKTKLKREDTAGEGILPDYYSVSEIEKYATFLSDKWLREQLDNLTEYGFLKKDRDVREGSDRKVSVYKYLDIYKIEIPVFQELQNYYNSYNHTITTISSNPSIPNQQKLSGDINKVEAIEGIEASAQGTADKDVAKILKRLKENLQRLKEGEETKENA